MREWKGLGLDSRPGALVMVVFEFQMVAEGENSSAANFVAVVFSKFKRYNA
jgi:hypothetical protein